MFASGWETKEVWIIITYIHKSWDRYTDASNAETRKSIWSMNTGKNWYTAMVGMMGILVALFKSQMGQGYSKSGIFYWIPSTSTFNAIRFSLITDTRQKCWQIKRFFKVHRQLGKNIPVSLRVAFEILNFEDSLYCFDSGRVISKNSLEGQLSHNVQEDHI